ARSDKRPLRSIWRSAFSFGSSTRVRRASASGFTLAETVVAVLISGVMLPPLFTGLGFAFSGVQEMRDGLPAPPIFLQRMESIRLASFNALQNPAAYPVTSTEYYSPSGKASGNGGTVYTLTYNWASGLSSLPPSYRSNMMVVTVTAAWKSGSVPRTRSM